jgi:hypothetical protein
LKLLFKAFIYTPLLLTAYLVTGVLLRRTADGVYWFLLIIAFTYLLYQLIFFIKGLLITLKFNGNLLWVPLYITCVLYTSVLPAWILFNSIESIAKEVHLDKVSLLILSGIVGAFIYSQYKFLINIAPVTAYSSFRFGITCGNRWLRVTNLNKSL